MLYKKDTPSKNPVKKFMHDQQMGARRTVMEEIFNDYYNDRRSVYKMNFFRGIFFGLGSVLGGTIVIAFIVWGLSWFTNVPWIGDTVEKAQDSLRSSQEK